MFFCHRVQRALGLLIFSAVANTATASSAANTPYVERRAAAPDNLAAVGSPIRAARPLAVLGEVGYNGLSGMGLVVGYNVYPKFALDAGVGLAAQGVPKYGLRLRYNFSDRNFSPFVAAGATLVVCDGRWHPTGNKRDLPEAMRLNTTVAAVAVLGSSYVANNGLTLLVCGGLAVPVTPSPTYEVRNDIHHLWTSMARDLSFSSPIVVSVAGGYAF